MKRIFRILFTSLKWLIAVLIMVEIASFLAISISNYWIYGQLRDGEPVHYDPYALFLEGVRPTAQQSGSRQESDDRLAVRRLHHAGRLRP